MIKQINKIKYLIIPVLMFGPSVIFAATTITDLGNDDFYNSAANSGGPSSNGLDRLLDQADGLIVRLIPMLVSLAVLLFLWGVLKYVFAKSDGDKKDARNFMIWGIVGLFVMVSVWGLVRILGDVVFGSGKATGPGTMPWPANERR